MAVAVSTDLSVYCRDVAQRAKAASATMAEVNGEVKNRWLMTAAKLLRDQADAVLAANALDLEAATGFGLTAAAIDRLKLTAVGVEKLAGALEHVARLPDPVGEIIESTVRPNGLEVQKLRVPLGVIFFIYESRPDVTLDAAALCVKSGNAVILRGGKEAVNSNRALAEVLAQAAMETDLPAHAVQLVQTTDRDAVGLLLGMADCIDLAIPRGGEGLIRRVVAEARMPVMKHFDGNCHVYIDRAADADMAERILVNSKCHRLGVCNAAESLLVHADRAQELLPRLAAALIARGIEIRGDDATQRLVSQAVAAEELDWSKEYLGPIISVCVVADVEEAIAHINRYGSRHTDAIVTADLATARKFVRGVDTAAVMVNASTRFNDGGELGLGAEIGISTDKFHARGPCGLKELTSYKWVCYGDGHVR